LAGLEISALDFDFHTRFVGRRQLFKRFKASPDSVTEKFVIVDRFRADKDRIIEPKPLMSNRHVTDAKTLGKAETAHRQLRRTDLRWQFVEASGVTPNVYGDIVNNQHLADAVAPTLIYKSFMRNTLSRLASNDLSQGKTSIFSTG
jgi:hypothetical protein